MRRVLFMSVLFLPPPQLTGHACGQMSSDNPLPFTSEQRLADLEDRSLQTFTDVDLADYLKLLAEAIPISGTSYDPADRIRHFALKSIGQSYRLNATRFDYSESDCVVFVERCLAMALARDWESYRLLCDRLRHKNGQVDYRNRNFFTLGDWLPNNRWLLNDITGTLISSENNPDAIFTYVVRPKLFEERSAALGSNFIKTTFKGSDYSVPGETHQDTYIPVQYVREILPQLHNGDVILVLRKYCGVGLKPWFDCDHMGIAVWDTQNTLRFVHSAPPAVRSEQLDQFVDIFRHVAGIKVLRIRSDAIESAGVEVIRMGGSWAFDAPKSKITP